jgi:ribonuclease HI
MSNQYKYQDKLSAKARQLIESLLLGGVDVQPEPVMFRDYMVRLALNQRGTINIYYSAKRDLYTLKLQGVQDATLTAQIEKRWKALSPASEEPKTQATRSKVQAGYCAYVDGSYINGYVGYGAVILHDGQEVQRLFGPVTAHTQQRQVVGELAATMQVLKWCEEEAVSHIVIYYDYTGIERWATNRWQANNPATQHYKRTVQASPVHVKWQKVKSHSGDNWNDVADGLAKQAAISQLVAQQGNVDGENC